MSKPELLSYVVTGSDLPKAEDLALRARARLHAAGDDQEAALSVLRSVKQEQILRCAVAELAGVLDAEAVEKRLTMLAEVLIGLALDLALSTMRQRYGTPIADDGSIVQVAVVAGGSLGAREMGYRSDVDLSVLYSRSGQTTGGARGIIGAQELFTRTVQRLLQHLTLKTAHGDLYPVDMGLRPSGSQGALVLSFENFRLYHRRAAQLWERQALVRTRAVAGDAEFCRDVDAAIAAAVYGPGPTDDAATKIRIMRERMRAQRAHRSNRGRALDLKLGPGGLGRRRVPRPTPLARARSRSSGGP